MKRFISFIASSVLAFGLQQDIKTPLQNTNYKAKKQHHKK